MKKKYLSVVLATAMTASLIVGCGSASTSAGETTEETAAETAAEDTTADEAETDAEQSEAAADFMPSDFVQERALKDTFDTYDDIISYLNGENEGFAYVQITGSTAYALAVSDKVAADGTSSEAAIYAYNDDNKLVNVGNAFSDETHPLLSDDSTLYACTDTQYGEMQINSETHGLMYVKYIEKDTSEDAALPYLGFVRETAESDTSEDHGIETDEQFQALFDGIADVPAITFAKAAYASYDEIISTLSVGEGYAYVTLNGYDGDILATCTGTYEDGGNHAIDALLYVENNGKAELLASVQTGGTAYPVTIDGGILYYNTPVQYAEADVTTNADGKYQLNYIKYAAVSYDADGNASYITKGSISASDITSEDDFYNLFEGSDGKTAVDFTLVK